MPTPIRIRYHDHALMALIKQTTFDLSVGAHRTLSELDVKAEQVDEVAASIVCLSSSFKQLVTDDVAAILRKSM